MIGECSTQCCPGCKYELDPSFLDKKPTLEFWEFFGGIVDFGEKVDRNTKRNGFTDTNGDPNERDKCGARITAFDLRFYCGTDMLTSDRPDKWRKGTENGLPSGQLASTSTEPSFWKIKPIEKRQRIVVALWNCCKGNLPQACPAYYFHDSDNAPT